MAVWALGINHHTAPLDLRGRFAFALDQIAPSLQGLRQSFGAAGGRHPAVETAILSTCNRTEIYCAATQAAPEHTLDWLAASGGVSAQQLQPHAYLLQDDGAARHAFRVASGLDSMVRGEAQILGQMKNAVRVAGRRGRVGVHAQPALSAQLRRRQGSAHQHRHWRAQHQHGRRRRASGQSAV